VSGGGSVAAQEVSRGPIAGQGGQRGLVKVATLSKVATLLVVASACGPTTNFKVASKVAKSVHGGW
jgi:hypothetical protein